MQQLLIVGSMISREIWLRAFIIKVMLMKSVLQIQIVQGALTSSHIIPSLFLYTRLSSHFARKNSQRLLTFFLSLFHSLLPSSTSQSDSSHHRRRSTQCGRLDSSCRACFGHQLHFHARPLSLSNREVWMRSCIVRWLRLSAGTGEQARRHDKFKTVRTDLLARILQALTFITLFINVHHEKCRIIDLRKARSDSRTRKIRSRSLREMHVLWNGSQKLHSVNCTLKEYDNQLMGRV